MSKLLWFGLAYTESCTVFTSFIRAITHTVPYSLSTGHNLYAGPNIFIKQSMHDRSHHFLTWKSVSGISSHCGRPTSLLTTIQRERSLRLLHLRFSYSPAVLANQGVYRHWSLGRLQYTLGQPDRRVRGIVLL